MSNWRQIRRLARCTAGVSVLSTFVGCRDQVQSIPTEPTVDLDLTRFRGRPTRPNLWAEVAHGIEQAGRPA